MFFLIFIQVFENSSKNTAGHGGSKFYWQRQHTSLQRAGQVLSQGLEKKGF